MGIREHHTQLGLSLKPGNPPKVRHGFRFGPAMTLRLCLVTERRRGMVGPVRFEIWCRPFTAQETSCSSRPEPVFHVVSH